MSNEENRSYRLLSRFLQSRGRYLFTTGNISGRQMRVNLFHHNHVCVCVCIFIKLHITAQSGLVILVILCHSR